MSRFLPWFTTKNGKLFTHTCVGIGTVSIFGVQIAFHGPMQDKFKKIFQIYEHGKEKPLSPKVKEIVDCVLKDSHLDYKEKEKIKFFNVIGHDVFHAGGISSPWGAMIGIPYVFENSKDINFSQLRLEGHDSIDWIVDGSDLLDALSLSDKAKKFVLMREIYSCDIWSVLDNASISAAFFLLPAEFARRVNAQKDIFKTLNLKWRISFYSVCYVFSSLMYICLKDPLKHLASKKCDRLAAATGPEYLEGGIEFYQKTMLKNKALREILGEKGKRKFDKDGNENYFLFAPKLPVRKRLEMIEDLKR